LSVLLVAPHADDESLFACYQLIRLKARVLVCLDSGPVRSLEMEDAMDVLGRDWTMLDVPEERPDWMAVREGIASEVRRASTVIAPAFEVDGHEHHNQVARITDSFGHAHVIRYLTYRRGYGRSKGAVTCVGDKFERDLKLTALRCYQSQMVDPATAPWFPGGEYATFEEWVV